MSQRPKLTPLSALMPVKGQAVQPEQVGERASEHVSELARDAVDDPAVQGFNGRLATDFPPMAATLSREQARSRVGSLESERAVKHVSGKASERTSTAAEPDDPSEYIDGPRSSVSFRMTERLKDRLREYAHHSRRQKQDIMDQATHEFLRRQGF